MATLRHLASNTDYPLSPRHLLGRAPACQLRVSDSGVSGFHAELVWDGEGWNVQDLGSRNGTSLGGRTLAKGEQARLPCEVDLVLAGTVRLRLIDDAPPQLLARAADGEVRVATDELLCLPSDAAPELTMFRGLDGSWCVETDSETRELAELDTLIAGGRSWQVFSPKFQPLTREVSGAVRLAERELRFSVSRDGEHVELELVRGAEVTAVEPRAHHFLLLALARARLRDAASAELPEVEHGWTYRDELPRMLSIEPELINLWIHRARKQLAKAGIRDAAGLVERRSAAGQLRIGTARLRILDA